MTKEDNFKVPMGEYNLNSALVVNIFLLGGWNWCSTRGQWPYRPASKERAMTNRPVIIYDFNFLGSHIKERKKVLPRAGIEPWTSGFTVQHLNHYAT